MPEDPAANAALIDRFYTAFAAKDHATMASCYADDAHFSDPVFTDLDGPEVRSMWRMLCETGSDLTLEHSGVAAEGDRGSAHWEADYTFSGTGRPVHNVIDASFQFRDGLILDHRDRFSFWGWTRQALGPIGVALGWSPIVQGKVRGQAGDLLKEFMAEHPPPPPHAPAG